MKTSLRHAVAMAALTGVLSISALAATVPAAAVSDIPAGAGQPMAPGGSALPPGTAPSAPSGNVRPETLMTPDSDKDRAKKPAVERIDPTKHQPATPDPKSDTQKQSH